MKRVYFDYESFRCLKHAQTDVEWSNNVNESTICFDHSLTICNHHANDMKRNSINDVFNCCFPYQRYHRLGSQLRECFNIFLITFIELNPNFFVVTSDLLCARLKV